MASLHVKNAIESSIDSFILDETCGILFGMRYLKTSQYTESRKLPRDTGECISTRFPGSAILRDEIGCTSDDGMSGDNLYTEDSAFMIDTFVRINPRKTDTEGSIHVTSQDRLYLIMEAIRHHFLGKTFDNVEIFGVQTGTGRPDDAEIGWWADSLSFQYHFEHVGP